MHPAFLICGTRSSSDALSDVPHLHKEEDNTQAMRTKPLHVRCCPGGLVPAQRHLFVLPLRRGGTTCSFACWDLFDAHQLFTGAPNRSSPVLAGDLTLNVYRPNRFNRSELLTGITRRLSPWGCSNMPANPFFNT